MAKSSDPINEITCKKSDLVQELLMLKEHHYSLKNRAPLVSLYDIAETDVLLMMGRQYGKSTFLASDSLVDLATMPHFQILYVSPRQDQTSEFSNSKLLPFINFSPEFRNLCMKGPLIQNVNKKMFSNGAGITLGHAYHTADALRGISADKLTIDEVQDIIMGNVPIIEECLSGSDYQWRTYSGTPKTLTNTLAQLWNRTTQNEWIMKCPHCNVWNILMLENIGEEGLICKKCGKSLPMDSQAEWVAKHSLDEDNIYMTGFRVPQLISPTVKWSRILEKMRTYPTAKFMNEVMALPYDNSANPITESELEAICNPDRKNTLTRDKNNEGFHLFLGVDWGHGDVSLKARRGGDATGYTVVTLGCYDYSSGFRLLGAKKFTGIESDPIFQVNYIAQLANRLKVTAIGVDFGGGFMHNAQLKDKLGPNRIIEWQANDSLRVAAKWIPEASRMIFNRTECMTNIFVDIKNKKVNFFNWKEFQEGFASDFLTICVDYRGNGRDMYYSHVLPDDAFHSYMMCKMTADHILYSQQA